VVSAVNQAMAGMLPNVNKKVAQVQVIGRCG
jgi:hypothetical protein